uniref:Endonuclease/exonuclease/phosphatase domain-containing protein n=1 Tax=Tetraselmis chuii TaxID=63592 RepID=A0A6U1J5H5_9CHLO
MAARFHALAPAQMDTKRNQNSVILLAKEPFATETAVEVTDAVVAELPSDQSVPVAPGDICAYKVASKKGNHYMLASFHGDTNGLATIPVVKAVSAVATKSDKPRLLFGLDANTYEKGVAGKTQDVAEFGEAFRALGLTSCWGDVPDPANYTTFNARTFLQPQLNKAVRMAERKTSSLTDRNPKDFILFSKEHFVKEVTIKDNTGAKSYDEDMPFPTLDFPSDHGVVASALRVLIQDPPKDS